MPRSTGSHLFATAFLHICQVCTTRMHANPANFSVTEEDDVLTLRLWGGERKTDSLELKNICLRQLYLLLLSERTLQSVLLVYVSVYLFSVYLVYILLTGISVLSLLCFQGYSNS